MNAWLLTWEGTPSPLIVPDNKIVAIVSSRRSAAFIEDLADVLYCRSVGSAFDVARMANKKRQRHSELKHMANTPGRFLFGRNPFIFARQVTDLNVHRDDSEGIEVITWTEPPRWEVKNPGDMPMIVEAGRQDRVVRKLNAPLSRDLRVKWLDF